MKRILSSVICFILLFSLLSFSFSANSTLEQQLKSDSYIVMDAKTGQIVYAKNQEKEQTLSGITKVMTAALALEALSLDSNATATSSAVGSDAVPRDTSNISLVEGEVVDVKSLLYAMLLKGANDAANVLAEASYGSIENFVKQMNEKASAIGCQKTVFYNANGLTSSTSENNVSTAYDMALIMKYAMENAYFKQIIKQTAYVIPATNKNESRNITTSHSMLKKTDYYEYLTGGVVSYSGSSGYSAVSSAEKDDKELICIVMNCPQSDSRYSDTRILFDYVLDNFQYVTLTKEDIPSKTVDVHSEDGTQIIARATLTLPGDISILLHNEIDKKSLTVTDTIPELFTKEASNQTVTVSSSSDLIYSPIAVSYLQASTETLAAPESVTVAEEVTAQSKNSFGSVVLGILKVIGIIILVIIGLAVIFIVYAVVTNNKRRKKRRRSRGRDDFSDEDESGRERRGRSSARRDR